MNKDFNLHLDWLSFTWKPSDDQIISESIIDCFHAAFPMLDPLFENATEFSGMYVYEVRFICNYHIVLCYDTAIHGGKGLNVSIPAQGLFKLYDCLGISDAIEVLKYLRSRGCMESRVDLAFDDFDQVFLPQDYAKWDDQKLIVTNFRKKRYYKSESDRGHTFQFGTRKTKRLLRIYDKDYESRGETKSIRYEFEFHGIHARQIIDYLLDRNGLVFQDLLTSWIRVTDPDHKVETRAHRRTLPAWEKFLQLEFSEGKPVKLPGRTHVASLNNKAFWVSNVVPLVASSLYHAYGEDAMTVLYYMARQVPFPDSKLEDEFYLREYKCYIKKYLQQKFHIDFETGEYLEEYLDD